MQYNTIQYNTILQWPFSLDFFAIECTTQQLQNRFCKPFMQLYVLYYTILYYTILYYTILTHALLQAHKQVEFSGFEGKILGSMFSKYTIPVWYGIVWYSITCSLMKIIRGMHMLVLILFQAMSVDNRRIAFNLVTLLLAKYQPGLQVSMCALIVFIL